jgi:hypothetical protein
MAPPLKIRIVGSKLIGAKPEIGEVVLYVNGEKGAAVRGSKSRKRKPRK